MDKRLEKIRHFQANVKDFESYINDRIKETKKENKAKVNESYIMPDSLIETINENIRKVFGKQSKFEFRQTLPLDYEDRPKTDKQPYCDTICEYSILIAGKNAILNAYVSMQSCICKYFALSYYDISLDPINGRQDELYDLPISVKELAGNPIELRRKCAALMTDIAKTYDYNWEHDYSKIYNMKNESLNIGETYEQYGLTPSDNMPEECLNFIINNIEDFNAKYDLALKEINKKRCSLRYADNYLFNEIVDLANEWANDHDMPEITEENIEESFD